MLPSCYGCITLSLATVIIVYGNFSIAPLVGAAALTEVHTMSNRNGANEGDTCSDGGICLDDVFLLQMDHRLEPVVFPRPTPPRSTNVHIENLSMPASSAEAIAPSLDAQLLLQHGQHPGTELGSLPHITAAVEAIANTARESHDIGTMQTNSPRHRIATSFLMRAILSEGTHSTGANPMLIILVILTILIIGVVTMGFFTSNSKYDDYEPFDRSKLDAGSTNTTTPRGPAASLLQKAPSPILAAAQRKSPQPRQNPGPGPSSHEELLQERRLTEQNLSGLPSNSGIRFQEETAVGLPSNSGPPVLCPSLVLPNTEARFQVAMDSLVQADSVTSLDITGTSGRKLLHAAVGSEKGSRFLRLCSVGCEDDPRAAIYVDGNQMKIFGRSGRFYGTLQAMQGGPGTVLICNGSTVMMLERGQDAPENFRMTATTMDGQVLATAGRSREASNVKRGAADLADPQASSTRRGNFEVWKLTVRPGCDAVLIASCMLAMIILKSTVSPFTNVRAPGSPMIAGPM